LVELLLLVVLLVRLVLALQVLLWRGRRERGAVLLVLLMGMLMLLLVLEGRWRGCHAGCVSGDGGALRAGAVRGVRLLLLLLLELG
jgi:hypothetical protein